MCAKQVAKNPFPNAAKSINLLRALAGQIADNRVDDLTPFARHIDAVGSTVMHLPVLQHLHEAIQAGEAGPCAGLITQMHPIVDHFPWNCFYRETPLTRPFLNDFGVIELVGPKSPLQMENVVAGIFLLGPHTTYPEHRHRADEVYTVVSGQVHVLVDDIPHNVRAGQSQYVPSGAVHALRTGAEPMLALYTWIGAVHDPVYFRIDGCDVQMPLLDS
jgi:mannose-6-phosphate isomerase-like protein (cupin superfamily)